ncbi:MAG: glutamate-ammonia-ligase adenylyltransferase, partial [Pirellulaceae bacterium]
LANYLIEDPEGFDLMRASDGLPAQRRYLVDELISEMRTVDDHARATHTIGNFIKREMVRIAYGEFVRSMSPDQAGRQLAWVADAALESALEYSLRICGQEHDQPQRIDGELPRLTVIGLGNFGGQELSYASLLEIVFLYDAIDEKNPSHQEFYRQVANRTVGLVSSHLEESPGLGFRCELGRGPYRDESLICGVDEAVDVLETKNRTWQRMAFAKSRVVAGDTEVGEAFISRIQPWIYHRFMSQSDFDDVRTLRRKLERRAAKPIGSSAIESRQSADVLLSAGGRRDIELTVQFLQLFHGGDSPTVRVGNTVDAIVALEKDGCLLHAEAELLAANYARLCRLHHQLSVMFGRNTSHLPVDEALFNRVAWRLGVRDEQGENGDGDRFAQQLSEALSMNCTVINHLMIDAPDDGDDDQIVGGASDQVETELVLDPDASPALIQSALSQHGLTDALAAMENLSALSRESVAFLSPRRCRHFLAAIAPKLLKEISKTPYPDRTLQSLVEVTDSLGAKATLWELLGANPPTMDLMVRLCSSAAYLRNILIRNPGMIDELVDSLLMNRLPSGDRLDAQSIELCRGAADVDLILQGFKNSAHLTIGVRDILDKESVEATHRALADTAEACLRRVIENEQAALAAQLGDPVGEDGEPAELIALALGKFGGREPNYHSDLDVIFFVFSKGRNAASHWRTANDGHQSSLFQPTGSAR